MTPASRSERAGRPERRRRGALTPIEARYGAADQAFIVNRFSGSDVAESYAGFASGSGLGTLSRRDGAIRAVMVSVVHLVGRVLGKEQLEVGVGQSVGFYIPIEAKDRPCRSITSVSPEASIVARPGHIAAQTRGTPPSTMEWTADPDRPMIDPSRERDRRPRRDHRPIHRLHDIVGYDCVGACHPAPVRNVPLPVPSVPV